MGALAAVQDQLEQVRALLLAKEGEVRSLTTEVRQLRFKNAAFAEIAQMLQLDVEWLAGLRRDNIRPSTRVRKWLLPCMHAWCRFVIAMGGIKIYLFVDS